MKITTQECKEITTFQSPASMSSYLISDYNMARYLSYLSYLVYWLDWTSTSAARPCQDVGRTPDTLGKHLQHSS